MWDVSDEALFAGYATGDRAAATVFVRRFQAKVLGLALAITRNQSDAEEVAQEAFLRAFRYAASYDVRRGAVVGWLLGIVRNVALDRIRVSSGRREEPVADAATDATGDVSDPTEAVHLRHDARRVAASMRALPAEQRDALLAVTLRGLSARELSDATGVPLGTVKTRIRLGLRKLRDELDASVGSRE